MIDYLMLYFIEFLLFLVTLIVGIILIKFKFKKDIKIFSIITISIFTIVFLLTFIFEKPKMELKQIENIEVNTMKNLETPNTYYHFKDVTDDVKVTNNINFKKTGEYYIKFEVETLFGKYEELNKVKVVDTKSPEITLKGDEYYKQSYSKEYIEPGYVATDLYDGDLTNKVKISKEQISEIEYNIKYEVEDSSGNRTQKLRFVTIVDDIPPVITLNGNVNTYVNINENYEEKGATAVDEKEGDLTTKISIEGTVDTSKEGNYTIIYKVSDSNGNEAIKKRIVTIVSPSTLAAHDGNEGTHGVIYLTFDDGPSSSSTPKILDILKAKGVKATFFILNYDSTGEELVKREYNEGHTVAIHGYSHTYSEIYQSIDTYMNNITRLQEKIRNSIGYNATVTRFPGGSSNTISKKYCVGIMSALTKEVVARGYTYFDWNVDSNDAGGAKTSDDVYRNVTSHLSKSRANVVLMHDFSGNNKTIDALESIIDYGLANGYSFERITEDTPMVTHTPNN